MVYLIGGSPRAGKSILARKLSRSLAVPYISTDNLRPVIMPYFPRREQADAFPFEMMFAHNNREEFFNKYSGKEMLEADIIEANSIWPGIKSLIEYLISCRMDYIIEGVHLFPHFVKRIKNKGKLKIIYLVKKDEEKILRGLLKNNNEDWISSHIRDKDILKKAAKTLSIYGNYFVSECRKYRFKTVNTEDNFRKSIFNCTDKIK